MKNFAEYPPELAAEFIEQWEGFKERAYICPAGVLTVGFGHTGDDVQSDTVVTYKEAYELLCKDIKERVLQLAPFINTPVTEGQFVALASLIFNVGVGSVKGSRLLRKLNEGDIEGAAEEFTNGWNTAGGKVLPGLTRRRKAEQKLFLEEA